MCFDRTRYVFSENSTTQKKLTTLISFGGGCVNDALVHAITPYAPFGGVGPSGIGAYHGKYGFENLSHFKVSIFWRAFIYKAKFSPDFGVHFLPISFTCVLFPYKPDFVV